jgi:hypothetical protein
MAKRYKQSVRDRMDEGEGMAKYWLKKEEVSHGRDEGARSKYDDSDMIREDRSAPSNLPQQVIHKMYPKLGYGVRSHLEDTIRGVDRQIDDDMRQTARHRSHEKY